LTIENYDLIIKSYEKGNMEDGSSGIDINPDGSADSAGNSKLRARALALRK